MIVTSPPAGLRATLISDLAQQGVADRSGVAERLLRRAPGGLGGPGDEVGVSVLDPAEVQLLSAVPTPMPVMVEAAVLERQPHLAEQLTDAGHRLVLRSLFAGGRRLRDVPPEHRAAAITRRLSDVVAAFNPWAVVIAPRTPMQLADYLDALDQFPETVGRRP